MCQNSPIVKATSTKFSHVLFLTFKSIHFRRLAPVISVSFVLGVYCIRRIPTWGVVVGGQRWARQRKAQGYIKPSCGAFRSLNWLKFTADIFIQYYRAVQPLSAISRLAKLSFGSPDCSYGLPLYCRKAASKKQTTEVQNVKLDGFSCTVHGEK